MGICGIIGIKRSDSQVLYAVSNIDPSGLSCEDVELNEGNTE